MNLTILSYILFLAILSFTSAATLHGRRHRHSRTPNISLTSATVQEIEKEVSFSTEAEERIWTHRSHRYKHTLVPVRSEVMRVEQSESASTTEFEELKERMILFQYWSFILAVGLLLAATLL